MDRKPTATATPAGWADSIARGEADLAAGRVLEIDTESLCREIEAEAEALEEQRLEGRVSQG